MTPANEKNRILIVDDEEAICKLISHLWQGIPFNSLSR